MREPMDEVQRAMLAPVVERSAADAERASRDIHDGLPRGGALR